MNIYKALNEITTYIDNHLEEKIDYEKLAKIMATNVCTMKKIFSLLTNMSLSEYIRKRRLSNAGFDLYNSNLKIMDIAIKYQYDNATSFSRAFETFHGIKPREIKKGNRHLKNFPKITFEEKVKEKVDTEYDIIELDKLTLYGKAIKTTEKKISKDAPLFYEKMKKEYFCKYGNINYGMVIYEERYESENFEYCILWNKEIKEFDKFVIPKSKWLIFHIPSTKAKDIQKASQDFYVDFLPSSKYKLRDIPELEYYHDGVTDFLVPIE